MVYCSIVGCKTSQKSAKEQGIKLFRFPSDPVTQNLWIKACGRTEPVNIKNARVCSLHFRPEVFEKPLIQSLLEYSPKSYRKIKPDAVPTEMLTGDLHLNRNDISENPFEDLTEQMTNKDSLLVEHDTPMDCEMPTTSEAIRLENELCMAQQRESNLAKEVSGLQTRIVSLENELAYYKNIVEKQRLIIERNDSVCEDKIKNVLGKILTEGQVKMLLSGKKKIQQWSKEDIASAISLRSVSPKAYRYLREKKKWPLPGLSTLRNYAAKFHVTEGLQEDTLLLMKNKGICLTRKEKITCLCFDEMYISPLISYDKAEERVVGPHRRVQVIMARGLLSDWKQPVFYSYDFNMNKEMLSSVISSLYNSNYNVVSITNDMGTTNIALWNSLNVSYTNSSFNHPNTNDDIFVFADVPHILKAARNNLLDSGFVLANGSYIGKNMLEHLVHIEKSDIKVSFKLTQFHLDVVGQQRQKVKWATQLFSNTTAAAVKHCGERGMLNDYKWQDAYPVIQLFNDWFDVLNSFTKFDKCSGRNAFGLNLERQENILERMDVFARTMRVHQKRTLLPFQKGILITNKSLRLLFCHLKQKYHLQYILTRRINQDCLENFFSFIRAMGATNSHPTPMSFQYRLKWYILGKHPDAVYTENRNTEDVSSDNHLVDFHDNSVVMSSDLIHKSNVLANKSVDEIFEVDDVITLHSAEGMESNVEATDEDLDLLKKFELQIMAEKCNLDELEEDALLFISGYVAYRFMKNFPGLSNGFVTQAEMVNLEKCKTCDWLACISKGRLTRPTDDFLNIAKLMESEFRLLHGNGISHQPGIVKEIVNKIKGKVPEGLLSEDVLHCLVRTRTFFRIRSLNREIHEKLSSRRNSQLKRRFQ